MLDETKLMAGDASEIFRRFTAGDQTTEIAADYGVSDSWLRRWATGLGFDMQSRAITGTMDVRRALVSVPDEDRVEFLLELIEWYRPEQKRGNLVPLALLGFSELKARLLVMLRNAGGCGMSRDAIWNGLYGHVPDGGHPLPDGKIIQVHICHLRKRLAKLGWPVQIVTAWGVGYRLVVKQREWQWPDLVAPE